MLLRAVTGNAASRRVAACCLGITYGVTRIQNMASAIQAGQLL